MKPRRPGNERAFEALCLAAAVLPLLALAVLVAHVLWLGLGRVDFDFATSYPSRFPDAAGIWPGLVGTIYLTVLTAVVALPVGIGTAIYLLEYRPRSRIARLIELNIANLAGVPSIIYGLLGLEVFARTIGLGRSILAGGLTLGLLVLPLVTISAREALRGVPADLREAGMSLGATRWQMVRRIVLPLAFPRIVTGSVFAISRAMGEAAPLVALGALVYVDFLPDGLRSPFTALPIQIFHWVSRPQAGFAVDAAAGIIVLLAILLLLNVVALVLRGRYDKGLGA